MSRRRKAVVEDSDSMSTVSSNSILSEDEEVSHQSGNGTATGASTPATSVIGETKLKSPRNSRAAASRMKSAVKVKEDDAMETAEDEENETLSDLSEDLDKESKDEEPSSKKSRLGTTSKSLSAHSSSSSKKAVAARNSVISAARSSASTRAPSPEVVIYTKSSSLTPASSPRKRARSPAPLKDAKRRAISEKEKHPDVADSDNSSDEALATLARATSRKVLAAIAARRSEKANDKNIEVSPPSSLAPPTPGARTNAKPKQPMKGSKKSIVKASRKSITDVKGKGKKNKWTDDEQDAQEESAFELDSDAELSESSAKFTGDEQSKGAQSSDLTDFDELAGKPAVGSPAAAMAKLKKERAKRGSRGSKGKKQGEGDKLTWWQKNELALELHHPELATVWSDLKLMDVVKPVQEEQPPGLSLKLLPFQREGLYWMKQQEKGPWKGGMLADEMGMGKTIQTIALILSDHDPANKLHTLILAPTVAIMQWRNEFNKFTSGLKVCVWHGGNRTSDAKELLKFDIILTSYAVLESSFRRQNTGYKKKGELLKEQSVLHSIQWHRVILDEAHNIKDRSCNTARGAFALKSHFRWCLSGTPLQNRVGELYSLIRFLGAEPFSFYFCKRCPCKSLHWRFSNKRTCDDCGHTPMHHICYWNNEVLKPIQKYGATLGGHGSNAFEKLSLLLARMMLRRTKVERADDMGLPPRDVMVRRDFFTEEEEEFYSSLYSDVKRTFSTYVAAESLLNNYANVFQLLTRMRQTACHPDMVLKGKAAKALLGDSGASAAISMSICRLCLDEGDDPIMSKCRHVFCRECIRQYLETAIEVAPECPVCHLPLTIDLSQETCEEAAQARQGMLEKIDPGKWRTSTKIEALVEELSKLKTEDHSIKSLVFSQFTSFLDLIARRLQLAGFKIARLQGSMTPEARDRTVKYFMNTTDCTVFLLSLKAGGVALNLTEASRVYIMDPWWNPGLSTLQKKPCCDAEKVSCSFLFCTSAAEVQAMDRIHRIGQHRPVIVKRLVIENSIESKIIELGVKKANMVSSVLADDDQALGRLTPEDLSFLFTM